MPTVQAKSALERSSGGATALCNDGSFSQSKQKRGACSRHNGVKIWYGQKTKSNFKQTPKKSPIAHNSAPYVQEETMVWVNLNSGIFHCQGSRWYGKTKRGQSMPQTQALAKKYKPFGKKLCVAKN